MKPDIYINRTIYEVIPHSRGKRYISYIDLLPTADTPIWNSTYYIAMQWIARDRISFRVEIWHEPLHSLLRMEYSFPQGNHTIYMYVFGLVRIAMIEWFRISNGNDTLLLVDGQIIMCEQIFFVFYEIYWLIKMDCLMLWKILFELNSSNLNFF